PPPPPLFPYTTLFRSAGAPAHRRACRLLVAPYNEEREDDAQDQAARDRQTDAGCELDRGQDHRRDQDGDGDREPEGVFFGTEWRSEEHTSELQSRFDL